MSRLIPNYILGVFMPKISIIIPVYNMEKYLKQALDSVLNQTLKDIEIICIDDCSTDNSLYILKEYASRDKRFVILEQEINQGQGIARNRALDIAKGKYVMFLDPDDWYELDACELAYKQISKNKNDFVIFNHRVYYQQTGEYVTAEYTMKPFGDVIDCPKIRLNDVKSNFMIKGGISCNKIYNKKFMNKNKIRYGIERIAQDGVLFLECVAYAKTISILNKVLYNRRIHENNTIYNIDLRNETLIAEKNIYKKIKKMKIDKHIYNYYLERYMFKMVGCYRKYTQQDPSIAEEYYNTIRKMARLLYKNEDLSQIENPKLYRAFMRFVRKTYEKYTKIKKPL